MPVASNVVARLHRHGDTAGATASAVCLVHCLLTPVLVGLFPSVIRYLPHGGSFHQVLACVVVLLGAVAFVPGYRLHRRRSVVFLVFTGMALIFAAVWTGEGAGWREVALSVSGSVTLVTAHLLNRSFCRSCGGCRETADGSCQVTGKS